MDKNRNHRIIKIIRDSDGAYIRQTFQGDKLISSEPEIRSDRLVSQADEILKSIRARQEEMENNEFCPIQRIDSQKRLDEILRNAEYSDDEIESWKDTPIYKLGFEDGQNQGYADGYKELYKVLKAVETLLEPHLDGDCT